MLELLNQLCQTTGKGDSGQRCKQHACARRSATCCWCWRHGDAAVKAALARPGTLRTLCSAMARLPQPAQLKCLKCLKHLSCDPGMLEPLQVLPWRKLLCL